MLLSTWIIRNGPDFHEGKVVNLDSKDLYGEAPGVSGFGAAVETAE